MSENNTDLNEVFEEEMDDADVITVPIDETLSNSGEAADAAAVGAALALKADKDELPATIKVNNQPADNQGLILIDGTDIPVSDSNTKTLAEAIEEASEMTAATIPMTGEAGAATIGETIGVLQETVEGIAGNMSADKIPMSEAEDAETIAEAIGIIEDNVEELAETVEGMEQKTADKVLMETGSTVTVKDAIETLDRTAVKSVNRKLPDASGDVDLSVVPLAENLQSDKLQSIEGEFTLRTTGGTGSVSDGKAYPQHIYGNSRHDGFVAEVLNLTVIPIARTEPDEPITATIDRDTFLEEVEDSDTINLYYTTEWSEDPADYGVTVTGDPVAGDQITIVYVKEVRGTIVVAEPERLVGTGWNLFNYNAGYARVVKYSETYGYKIGGTFTSIAFAASLTDDRISLLPNIDGLFSVPGDGYVFVTGGNNTDTYILTTWSDWIEGPSTGYWEAYRESGIDLSAVVETYFPYGMLKVGTVRDEIDLVAKRTISRIERMVYNEENRATAAATGRAYDFDENNIYVVRAEPVLNAITIDSEYSVSEHGLEWFTETELPLDTEILYGKNLRDKLERNVLTISAQTLTEEEKSQVRTNIGAMSQAEGDTKLVAPTEAGTAGQLLHLKEDGGTEWTTQGTPTDAQVGTAVSAWLDAHPEATTTVEDGAISRAKLNADLKEKTDAVPDLKSALTVTRKSDTLETYNIFKGVTFDYGGFVNGGWGTGKNRIHSVELIDMRMIGINGVQIYVPDGYQWNAVKCQSNGDLVDNWSNTWQNSGATYTNDYRYPYIHLIIRKEDNTDLDSVYLVAKSFYSNDYMTKTNFDEKEITNYVKKSFEWVNGSIVNSEITTGNTKRLRTNSDLNVVVGTKIHLKVASGYRINYFGFDSNGVVKHKSNSWPTETDYTIVAKMPKYRFLIMNTDDTEIYPLEGSVVEISVETKENVHTYGKYTGKRISILGDSISTFGGDPSDDPRYSDGTYTYEGNHCRYPQNNLLTEVHQTYWMMLIDELQMTLDVNESWAGSRVSWDGTTESADIGANKYIASVTRIKHLDDNGTPDIILVNAGTNDIGANVEIGTFNTENPKDYTEQQIESLSVSTFYDAYRAMIIRLQYYYPLARIIVILPNYAGYTPLNHDNYCEAIKTVCDFFGVPYIDARTCGVNVFNRRSTYMPDGTHYNADGMRLLYMKVANEMLYVIS